MLPVDPVNPDPAVIAEAAGVLRKGGLVAFPTETVYGLGANALDPSAVARIYEAKGRDPNDPLIVHIADMEDLALVCRGVSPLAQRLAAAFWPGGLTLVLPRGARVVPAVSAGLDTVAVRMPSHPVARALIRLAGVPVAAPSANRFMRTSATTAAHVLDDLDGRIDLVLDGGPADAGIESTVVSVDGGVVTLLRPGVITVEAIESVVGRPLAQPGARAATGSPGMMERHYAPAAELVYLPDAPIAELVSRARAEVARGRETGILLADADAPGLEDEGFTVERLGPEGDLETVAGSLFAALRRMDTAGVEVIFARGFSRAGAGLAIDDRLRRASTRRGR